MPVLIANRAVGISLYYVSHLSDEATLAANGVPAFAMRYSDVGLDIYSNGIVARDETIKSNPDLVHRLVKSIAEGFAYTFDHPNEAANILVSKNPQLNVNLVVGDMATLKYLTTTPEASEKGFGYMDREKMIRTRDAVADAFNAPKAKEVASDDIYTDEFLK
jgi:NitT/TauT family transport system substrate-binding protein